MIIQLKEKIKPQHKETILSAVKNIGYKANEVKTQKGNYLVCIGKNDFDIRLLGSLKGVADVHRVSDSYKLVSKKWKVGFTRIEISESTPAFSLRKKARKDADSGRNDGVCIGGNEFAIMAGPCSIEGEEQVEKIVSHLKENNIPIMRGGVFKPRSSPYAFRGLGIDGLKMFHRVCKQNRIKIISEVMQVSQIKAMYEYVDIFQVGARNSQNFNLLDALGEVDKPVLLKRGMSGTLDELLQSAEYIFSHGNEKLLLCERGIRTYENAYRNTFDINAIPVLKEKTHLPVIADPSHGTGVREHVIPVALAAAAAGADGIIYEVHPVPEEAASDGQQTLNFAESAELIKKLKILLNR